MTNTHIGFLFNHARIHQVAHSLPIAIALARGAPDADIVVATTKPRLSAEVIRLGEGPIGSRIRFVELGLTRWSSRVLEGGLAITRLRGTSAGGVEHRCGAVGTGRESPANPAFDL